MRIGRIMLAAMVVTLAACSNEKTKKSRETKFELGKYIYVDSYHDCLHISNKGSFHKFQYSCVIDTNSFSMDQFNSYEFCSKCVDAEMYIRVKEIAKRNSKNEE